MGSTSLSRPASEMALENLYEEEESLLGWASWWAQRGRTERLQRCEAALDEIRHEIMQRETAH